MLPEMFSRSLTCLSLACAMTLGLTACGEDSGSDDTTAAETQGTSSESQAGDGDSDGEAGDGDTTAETSDSGADPNCGNGVVDDAEVCDDGNNVTEFPGKDGNYAPEDCMSDCSMVLANCGNGIVDPGEACDDGNMDSMDECTTSCTLNTQGVHAACTRSTGESNTDVSSGEITNCDQVNPESGYGIGCVLSTNVFNVSYVFAAEGDCQMISLKCVDANCSLAPPNIGDLDNVADCPAGHTPVYKMVGLDSALIPDVHSQVCQKICESDSECRWNARDSYDNSGWLDNGGTPYGQFRCQVTSDSNGEKICVDARNNSGL